MTNLTARSLRSLKTAKNVFFGLPGQPNLLFFVRSP
jgi:hypothetical protein